MCPCLALVCLMIIQFKNIIHSKSHPLICLTLKRKDSIPNSRLLLNEANTFSSRDNQYRVQPFIRASRFLVNDDGKYPIMQDNNNNNNKSTNKNQDDNQIYGNCVSVAERYEKLGRLGQGTYGIVYKARDRTNPQHVVALKRCIPHHQASDGFPVTTLREIQSLRLCAGHDHVVKLQDIAVSRNGVFLVFEYW